MPGRRKRRTSSIAARLSLAALAVSLSVVAVPSRAGSSRSAAAPGHPSIVLILTDDQRWDTLWAMPNVRRLLGAHGVTFQRAYVVNPLCCPSRASILTGLYSHSTGVYDNKAPYGAFDAFDDSSTVATWLDAAGYRTALIGKYLNHYRGATRGTYVPPGWDRWEAFDSNGKGIYYDYLLSVDGRVQKYGHRPQDYSTSVLTRRAVSFIRATRGPLFLYFATSAPHEPAIPGPGTERRFRDLPRWRPPTYDERDVSDKPAYVRARPRLSAGRRRYIDNVRRNQYRTLVSVDRAVRRIVDALRDTGRLHDTLIVFTSDNGYLWGEHRLEGKNVPYEESVRVPLVVRYDPLTTAPRVDQHLALNIDLAPTFAQLAGTASATTDGQSLIPLLASATASGRPDFLIEHAEFRRHALQDAPTYCAVHTRRYVEVAYATGERELYDLRVDPRQQRNRADDPGYSEVQATLAARAAQLCKPPPPNPGALALGDRLPHKRPS